MAFKNLQESMGEFFRTGEYSDMKIVDSTGHEYQAHRSIICGQSKYFRNALKQQSLQEDTTNTIALVNDHPEAVKEMLVYFYYGNYSDDKFGDTIPERIIFNIDVYAMGDRYEVAGTGLCEDACRRIRSLSISAWDKMKTSFHVILKEAYKKTPPGDSFLRPLLVDIAADEFDKLVMDKDFCEVMDAIGEFGRELSTRQCRLREDAEKYKTYKLRCPMCKGTVRMFLPTPGSDGWRKNSIYCIACGNDALICNWKQAIVKTY